MQRLALRPGMNDRWSPASVIRTSSHWCRGAISMRRRVQRSTTAAERDRGEHKRIDSKTQSADAAGRQATAFHYFGEASSLDLCAGRKFFCDQRLRHFRREIRDRYFGCDLHIRRKRCASSAFGRLMPGSLSWGNANWRGAKILKIRPAKKHFCWLSVAAINSSETQRAL